MKRPLKRVRRRSFTLVEVIAVLLVIAILSAVAAPKFVSMATEARNGVAKAGINEAKASLSVAYAKSYLVLNGDHASVTASTVLANAGFTDGATVAFGDINVTIAATNPTTVTLTAVDVRGTAVTTPADTWTVPVQ